MISSWRRAGFVRVVNDIERLIFRVFLRHGSEILGYDTLRASLCHDLAALQPERAIAQSFHFACSVRNEQDGYAAERSSWTLRKQRWRK